MITAIRLHVQGVVQGVGFRPFVYSLATELGLTGTVGNSPRGVVIDLEGEDLSLAEFATVLRVRQPPLARIDSVECVPAQACGRAGFRIVDTDTTTAGRTLAPPDVATCDDCLREMADPGNRRYRHPFITCTNCGPRFTIIEELPYDRAATTMRGFPMCSECAAEYADPRNRRFHAQPIACPQCGPTLTFVDTDADAAAVPVNGENAVHRAREFLRDGKIVAVKGIGGYHLACDARNESAVQELRARKRRRGKPLAVMVRDINGAYAVGRVNETQSRALTECSRPIVLVDKASKYDLAPSVAPGIPDIGIMLAYNPIQNLLLGLPGDAAGPTALVMTSANLGGEPILFRGTDLERVSALADSVLTHDRPIRVPCDDSVQRVVDGRRVMLRRSRGYAPLPIELPLDVAPILAVGADLKNTFVIADGTSAWPSQHIGDMGDVAVLDGFAAARTHFESITGVTPSQVVCDEHPRYHSSAWARRHAAGRPVRTVGHHHAHIAAVMGENGCDGSEPVIGMAFDGTGYGADGAVWGGEMLLATYKGFRRLAHLGYVALPGGDAGVERPYRMAMSHLRSAGIGWDSELPPVAACPARERSVLGHQLETGFGCVETSSMGRLFDAVAALAGVRQSVEYEAQAAIELEGISRGIDCGSEYYVFGEREDAGGSWIADPGPVIRSVVDDLRNGVSAGVIGARFHESVARLVVTWAQAARAAAGVDDVALSGGVFQNPLLLARARVLLSDAGFRPLTHHELPPNDGGLAYGQVLVGSSR
ncbi:UNVERIFIED_ORG: hydrogenase maturation carbamoyltransferase HypF [Nocardia globerula]|uniref:Carbamoyltransferase n=1 Tax=Nocardia globerula TaxID=1818 RepID=A0A652YKV8_NOCGL|nr:carbamoyltransferase HypF [Rhodococcus globerulus]NMD61776.1 carbamoyltransferase HypF [Nocardia globerula]PVX66147.1 hydrogenase maturation carbamoyltransferase HypF [Rhodococcus globerulus]